MYNDSVPLFTEKALKAWKRWLESVPRSQPLPDYPVESIENLFAIGLSVGVVCPDHLVLFEECPCDPYCEVW